MRTENNTPYVKSYNPDGTVSNPITATNPYVSTDSTRRQRRFYIQNPSSSKRNTPSKRQQIIFITRKKKFERLILLSPPVKQVVSFVKTVTKIIHHERK